MRYEVVTYGNAALKKKSKPVEKITDDIRRLAKDMLETMYARNGVGLAAEQIGRTESICVLSIPKPPAEMQAEMPEVKGEIFTEKPVVMINPEITELSGKQVGDEGCLSFPEIFASIKRAMEVTVVFTNLDGKKETVKAAALYARAIQHEVDHLNGVLLYDRMSTVQKLALGGKLRRLKKKSQV